MNYQEMERAAYIAGDYTRAALCETIMDLQLENADQLERIQGQDCYIQSLVREIADLNDKLKGLDNE